MHFLSSLRHFFLVAERKTYKNLRKMKFRSKVCTLEISLKENVIITMNKIIVFLNSTLQISYEFVKNKKIDETIVGCLKLMDKKV